MVMPSLPTLEHGARGRAAAGQEGVVMVVTAAAVVEEEEEAVGVAVAVAVAVAVVAVAVAGRLLTGEPLVEY